MNRKMGGGRTTATTKPPRPASDIPAVAPSESKNLKAREYEEESKRDRHRKKKKCTDSLNITCLWKNKRPWLAAFPE
jgi:hypothetical protein